jgi:hypothetical protein
MDFHHRWFALGHRPGLLEKTFVHFIQVAVRHIRTLADVS